MPEADVDFVVIGGVEMNQRQLDELLEIMAMPGWKQLCKIYAADRAVVAEDMMRSRKQRTLQELGVAQGRYQTASDYLDLAEVAQNERTKFDDFAKLI